MGDIADMMLEGILCEGCGGVVDGKATGHPRRCRGCGGPIHLQTALKRSLTGNARKAARHNRERQESAAIRKPFQCSKCTRRFRTEAGLNQHTHDTHNNWAWSWGSSP